MILSLIAILIVGIIAYLWSAQGLFSAFLHLVCTIVAGAVAFAAWEPLVYGVLLGVHRDLAWAVGLMAPFLVTLLLLRIVSDKLIPNNIELDSGTNFVGGLAFGGLSGVVCAGMLMLAIGHMRLPSSFLGYRPVKFDPAGNLVRGSGLWLPVDSLTVKFYETLSGGAFATATPLALRNPNAHETGALTRFTFGDKGLTAIKPEDFDVVGRYVVDGPPLNELLADEFDLTPDGAPKPQQAKMIDAGPYPQNSRLEGYIVRLKAGAKEKGGQFVISPGQFRLVLNRDEGPRAVTPIAVVGRAESFSFNLGRWRFDNNEPYYASVGGASDATFALEFIVPKDAGPERDLYVKLVRAALPPGEPPVFASVAERDGAIRQRSGAFEALATGAVTEAPEGGGPGGEIVQDTSDPIRVTERLSNPLNRSDVSSLELDGDNRILSGEATVSVKQLNIQGIDFKLRVERFASTDDTTIVQVDVSPTSRVTILGRALDAAEGVVPPVLVDNLGQQYEAVGYVHNTGSAFTVRFKPGDPIRGLSQLPTLSRSRPAERLSLIYRVSSGVQVVRFALGSKTILELNPPLQMPAPRAPR